MFSHPQSRCCFSSGDPHPGSVSIFLQGLLSYSGTSVDSTRGYSTSCHREFIPIMLHRIQEETVFHWSAAVGRLTAGLTFRLNDLRATDLYISSCDVRLFNNWPEVCPGIVCSSKAEVSFAVKLASTSQDASDSSHAESRPLLAVLRTAAYIP